MASIVFPPSALAVGASVLGSGFSVLGVAVTGAQIGGAIGALAGSYIDQALAPGRVTHREGPRLSDVNIQSRRKAPPSRGSMGAARRRPAHLGHALQG